MKKILLIVIIILAYWSCKKPNFEEGINPNLKEPELLFLKVAWYDGDVEITRNKIRVPLKMDLELEKEDTIRTGENGSIELLLGIKNFIKMGKNSQISITNLLTTQRETATNISLNSGQIVTVIREQSKDKIFTLVTPNLHANIENSIVFSKLFSKEASSNIGTLQECAKDSCVTNLQILNGSVHVKQPGNASDLVLDKNFQIKLSDETELAQNMIYPLENEPLIKELKNMLQFHSVDLSIDPMILEKYRIEQDSIKKQILTESKVNKEPKFLKKKINSKDMKRPKKTNVKKSSASNSSRDNLLLNSNKGF